MAATDRTSPADPRDTLWRDLQLPEFAKTFAAGTTIRGADWRLAATVLNTEVGADTIDARSLSLDGPSTSPGASGSSEGSGESVPDTASGIGLRRKLAELPSVTVEELDESGSLAELAVIDELGRGGMGVVLRAQQRSLEREVAVKRVRAKRKSQRAVEKLLEEARVTGSLEHPNIVPIHALGADSRGDPVLVMKRVEGVVWRELIKQTEHPRWEAIKTHQLQFHLEVLMQVCRALELAHSRQVIHRDVKPENVMVGDFGEVYLLDWGLALRLDRPPESESFDPRGGRGFNVVGTPSYMAPEMLTGAQVTERTDVFLVGATLFEVLTGQVLHTGDSLYQVIRKICERQPYAFDDSVPAELASICNKATALDPQERYPSMAALREAIGHYLQHRAAEQLVDEAFDRLRALQALRKAPQQQSPDQQQSDGAEDAARDKRAHALRVRKLATECRFGFKQALNMWPKSPRGRQGFEQALHLLIDLEIEEENEVAARALLDELPTPDEATEARVEALSERLTQERIKRGQLEAIARDQDLDVLQRTRGKQLLGLVLPSMVIATIVVTARRAYDWPLSYVVIIALGTAAPVTVLGLLLLSRVRSLRNQVNRRIVWGFLSLCASVLLLRIAGWRVGVPVDVTLLFELVATALGGTIFAIMTDYRVLRQAGFAMACAIVAVLIPDYALELLVLATMGGLSWLAFDWLRSQDDGAQ